MALMFSLIPLIPGIREQIPLIINVILTPALFAVAGALVALLILFSSVLRRPGHALPALPPISAGAAVGFAIAVLFF